jgi:lipopolysaccharide export system protein LptA
VIGPLVAMALLAAPSVASLPVAGGGQVTVSAKQFKYNIPKQRLEYTGDPVRFTRGDALLSCKQLVAQLAKGGEISEATCQGDVRFERGDKLVTCERALYQAAASRLTCEGSGAGKPSIKSGTISATGDRLVYDLAADEVTIDNPVGGVPAAVADAQIESAKKLQEQKKQKRGGQK